MGFELKTLVVIGTDCTGSCKSNYHTIMTTAAPTLQEYLYSKTNKYLSKGTSSFLAASTAELNDEEVYLFSSFFKYLTISNCSSVKHFLCESSSMMKLQIVLSSQNEAIFHKLSFTFKP